jgi:hypothetical protein
MVPRFVLAAVAVGLLGVAGRADDPAPDPTADLLAKLRKPADFAQAGEVQLGAFTDLVEARGGVAAVINDEAFRGEGVENPAEQTVKPSRLKTLSLAAHLRHALGQRGATYLVRKDHVEIVPLAVAVREAKVQVEDGPAQLLLPYPLVSAVYREKPFNEAVADLAADHDLTVVVAPQAGDNRTAFVSARLLNVPADKALELLALQADLRVLRKGNAFFVTGKDHADQLAAERVEKERQKIDLDRLRLTPLPPAAPAVPPPPVP